MLRAERLKERVVKAQEGDAKALRGLLEEARERLPAVVRSRLGKRLKAQVDAGGVVQETFTRALEALDRFRWQGTGSFDRWLASIAEHVILEAARKEEKRPRLALDPETPGSGVSPSKELRREERFERLEKALDRLSPAEREAVLLSRIERLKVDEIARRLGRSPDAVKQLLSRALKKLKESFGDTESLSLPDRALGGRPGGGGPGRGQGRGQGQGASEEA